MLSYTSVLLSQFSPLLKGTRDAVSRQNFHFNFQVIATLVSQADFVFEFIKLKSLSLWPYILYDLSQIPDSLIPFYAAYVAELQNWVSQLTYPLLSRLIHWSHNYHSPFPDFT